MRWAPVPGHEGLYEVSDTGAVKSLARKECVMSRHGTPMVRFRKEKVLQLHKDPEGYVYVVLCKNGVGKKWRIARLVLTAFVGASPLEAGHKNHKRDDNRLSNLEWVTRQENERQKDDSERRPVVAWAVLTRKKVATMRRLRTMGFTYKQLGERFGVHLSTVALACKGKTWA